VRFYFHGISFKELMHEDAELLRRYAADRCGIAFAELIRCKWTWFYFGRAAADDATFIAPGRDLTGIFRARAAG